MRTMAWKKAPSASPFGSGTHSLGIGRLRAVMQRYISTILVDSVLERAMKAQGTKPDLHGLTEECMIGLRLFVKESELPTLMLELAEILEDHDGR
jgi:hypothetical protein